MERDIKILEKRKAITSLYGYLPSALNEEARFSARIAESLAWFSSSVGALEEYYKQKAQNRPESSSYFWAKVPKERVRLHTGLPALISDRMSTVLFSAGVDITTEVYKDNGELDEELTARASEALQVILDENKIEDLYKCGAAVESWCGHLFARLSVDTTISSHPILEFVDLRNAEVIKTRGRPIGILFKELIEKEDERYMHYELYSTNEQGEATIQHSLTKLTKDGEINLPLTYLDETRDFAPVYTFSGLKGLLAFDKPNKLPNNEFPDSHYGASDYSGAYSSFDALDEIYSEIVSEAREHKTFSILPLEMFEQDGNGQLIAFNPFGLRYLAAKRDLMPDTPQIDPQAVVIPDKTAEHIEKFKVIQTGAINKAGLSPVTLGVSGLTAIDSSDKTLRERQKTTLETRQAKVRLWKPFLEQLFLRVLELDDVIARQNGKEALGVNSANTVIKVAFNDYVDNTFEERLNQISGALTAGTMSIDMAIDYLYGDELSDNEKLTEVNRIRFERGMAAETPDLLDLDFSDEEPSENNGSKEDSS